MITVRVSVFPTELLRYYILCPACETPIRGSMEGQELNGFDLRIESGFKNVEGDFPTVTVDPLIPMNSAATGLQDIGGGPNTLIFQLAGSEERALRLAEHSELASEMHQQISMVRPALEYYEQGKEQGFWAYLKKTEVLTDSYSATATMDEAAHQLWRTWLLNYAKATNNVGTISHAAQAAYTRWHKRAMNNDRYKELMTEAVCKKESQKLTKGLIAATRSMMGTSAAWRSGYLSHGPPDSPQLRNLVLLQDEFDGLRDCYQRVFEACCSALWPIIYV